MLSPIYAYFDKAVLAIVLISYDLGIYTTAYSAASLINILSNVYATKIFSDVAAGTRINIINDYLRQNTILMAMGALFLILIFPVLIPLVFGNDFEAAIAPSQFLIILCTIQGFSYIIERIILAKGYPYIGVKARGITMGLFAISMITLKFAGFINLSIIIFIISAIQIGYLLYILNRLESIIDSKITIIPKYNDLKSLYYTFKISMTKYK